MPKIEVFLMFDPKDRNSITKKGVKTIERGPDWGWIVRDARRQGYEVVVHEPSIHPKAAQIQSSMQNAEVTLLVGHGGATNPGNLGPKWISDQIKLVDGVIRSPDGLYTGKWKANGSVLDSPNKIGKLKINRVTGIFTCNSTDRLPEAFDLPSGSHFITNDGGKDGLTRVGTLEKGAAEFVKEYVRSKGNVQQSMGKAQILFIQMGKHYSRDKGDTHNQDWRELT
jgi:hypothetical protein